MRTIAIGLILVLMAIPAVAGTIGPNEIGDTSRGYKFPSPQDWVAQAQEGAYLFVSNVHHGLMLVEAHDATSPDELRTAARDGFRDEGVMLALQGEPEPFDSGIAARFGGIVLGEKAKAYAIGLIAPHGGGLVVLSVVAETETSDDYITRAQALARSVTFFTPEQSSELAEWRDWFRGARLTYMNSYSSGVGADGSYGGYSDEITIDLCEAGYFKYNSSSEMAIDGGYGSDYSASTYGSSRDSGNGQWSITERGGRLYLILAFYNGETYEYALKYEDKKTYLNDDRYFVTREGLSDGTGRPDCP